MNKAYDPQAGSYQQESAPCIQSIQSNHGSQKVIGGLWPNGKIYYKIGDFANNSDSSSGSLNILERARQAISEWNAVNRSYCEFVNIDVHPNNYYVTFQQVYDGTPSAHFGCWHDQTQMIQLPETYPYGSNVTIACILHQMMHCAGFKHAHPHQERDIDCTPDSKFHNFSANAVGIAQYDQYSLMHYEEFPSPIFKSKDVKRLVDQSPSFSTGDRAALKILYSPKGTHHGEWHKPCDSLKCHEISCFCGNCGLLEGGVCCGYWGNKGHWTCCMNEVEDSMCSTTHNGFWHAQCIKMKCTKGVCYCRNCGGGCTYRGSEGHWSCCNQETFKSDCKNKLKRTLYK